MSAVFDSILTWFRELFYSISRVGFTVSLNGNDVYVTYIGIMVVLVIIGLVVSVFWKGAKD